MFRSVPAQGQCLSKVHSVLSNRDLPSTSGGQPKVIATGYMFCDSWITLANISKEGFFLVLGFLLGSLWLLQGTLSARSGSSYLKYICIFIDRITYRFFRQTIAFFILMTFSYLILFFRLLGILPPYLCFPPSPLLKEPLFRFPDWTLLPALPLSLAPQLCRPGNGPLSFPVFYSHCSSAATVSTTDVRRRRSDPLGLGL